MQRSLITPFGFPRLSEDQLLLLNNPYSVEEIKNALFEMAPFKATGPDDMHAGFFQNSWGIVGD